MRILIVFLSSFLATAVYAEAEIDYDEVLYIRQKLYEHYDNGIGLRNSYDLNDLDQVKQCISKKGYLRNEVKQLQTRVKNLNIVSFRVDLTFAADAAFSCVYCGGKETSCEDVKNKLSEMDLKLVEAGKLP